MSDDLWAVEDLMKRLQVKRWWVYRRTQKNGPESIPFVRCGRFLRFRPSDIEKWLKERNNQRLKRA